MPYFRLASCCSVEVMNGGQGFRVAGLDSTAETENVRDVQADTAKSAAVAVGMSNFCSFLPPSVTRPASNSCPRGVRKTAFTVQYSWALKASISISRSTIRRRQTDCTRPADFAPGSLRHRTGDSVKPTR